MAPQPPSRALAPPRRARVTRGLAGSAVVGFTIAILLCAHRGFGSGVGCFVSPLTWGSVAQRRQASPLALAAAGADETPGSVPVLEDEEADVEVPDEEILDVGSETVEMMYDRLALRRKWLKSIKGKFVPVGPKPWDKHIFKKVKIEVRLLPKQATNTRIMQQVLEELRRISGAPPTITKSELNDDLEGWRAGMNTGAYVEIRGQKMRDFLKRFNMLVLPRVRDFEGLDPLTFTNEGNYFMMIPTQESFRELDDMIDNRDIVHGFRVSIYNTALTQPDGLKVMKDFGFPFDESLGTKRSYTGDIFDEAEEQEKIRDTKMKEMIKMRTVQRKRPRQNTKPSR